MNQIINLEKQQLLAQWAKIAALTCDEKWLESTSWKIKKIIEALEDPILDVISKRKIINGHIRKFTDKLGLQAWGDLKKGGQCAGAIYRTKGFIKLEVSERIGSKSCKTIHIEHTVPASVLTTKLIEANSKNNQLFNSEFMFFYLIKNAICTAMLDEQGTLGGLIRDGYASTTDALNSETEGYEKPFLRYVKSTNELDEIWDVWNDKVINPEEFTFNDHLLNITEIATITGSDNIKKLINKWTNLDLIDI